MLKAIQKKIEDDTGLRCYDYIQTNMSSPFYYVELVEKRPANSKTMYRTVYMVWIHVIAEPSKSSVPLYNYIQMLEEALTEDIELPEPFQLILQTDNGIQNIKTDETNEKHAIMSYEFMIGYGFMCKN